MYSGGSCWFYMRFRFMTTLTMLLDKETKLRSTMVIMYFARRSPRFFTSRMDGKLICGFHGKLNLPSKYDKIIETRRIFTFHPISVLHLSIPDLSPNPNEGLVSAGLVTHIGFQSDFSTCIPLSETSAVSLQWKQTKIVVVYKKNLTVSFKNTSIIANRRIIICSMKKGYLKIIGFLITNQPALISSKFYMPLPSKEK
ncbi:hypothetical protein VNO77_20086 [Canavalia gladiata]|uniref:Uncharacterized protein n=1 Tax=Canavalia gladiata TaxID=3824 RepID=A0AAN9LP09_CANGL